MVIERLKTSVCKAKTSLKGTAVSVREFLTRTGQMIFAKSHQHFGMKAVWTQDDTVVIEAPDGCRHKVTSMEHLHHLLEKHPKVLGDAVAESSKTGNSSRKQTFFR